MERSEGGGSASGSSPQSSVWKHFHTRAKPLLSPKRERGAWSLRRRLKRKDDSAALDRVLSSSQPDLLFPATAEPQPRSTAEPQPRSTAEPQPRSTAEPQPRSTAGGRHKPLTSIKRKSVSANKPTVAQLVQSHHTSSSAAPAGPEGLSEPPSGGGASAAETHPEREQRELSWSTSREPRSSWFWGAPSPTLTLDLFVSDAPASQQRQAVRRFFHCASTEESLSLRASCGRLLSGMAAAAAATATATAATGPGSEMYKLEIELKRGHNLAIRDRGGTSDPYVKFKLGGKEVFRSRTVHKNLNPVWDEKTTLTLDSLSEPLYVKVFDYDFGLQDDFMGSAFLYLQALEQHRTVPVTLVLRDPLLPDQDLGSLELAVTLMPKNSPMEEQRDAAHLKPCRWKCYVDKTMLLRRSWKRSNKQQQSMRLSELHRKSQLWRGIVSIALIQGRNLIPMDPNGLSDPYVKFRLGPQKYKSKTVPKTLSPQWREQFDLHLYEETGGVLEVTVWDKDTGRRDDFIGRCQLDLSTLTKEQTHHLELPLEESRGFVVLLVTLTASAAVSIADLSITPLDDLQERREILRRYGLRRSFSNLRDVGVVQVKVLRAEGLMAADVTGKSDPFCVLELNNDRLQTHTVYKNLNPEWNKVFTLNVKDIHSVLEVTVFDEDRDRSADFLGKVAIPLLSIRNGQQRAYLLKNKELTSPTKGLIYLEGEVIYNTIKAALRTVVPAEQKYIEEEPKVSKQLLQQNFNRVKRCILVLISYGAYINSCFEWESPQRSIVSFMLFVVVVWNVEVYMLPLALLLLLVWNYVFFSRETADGSMEAAFEWEDEEDDREDKDSKGFMDKLYAIQDVFIGVQSALDEAASFGERMKNTFIWTVPFLSWLAIAGLVVATLLLYLVPLRFLVLVWGVNKFTKKLRDPFMIDNNELLDFLSRVPSDVQVMQYRELRPDPGQSPSKRRRTNQS